LPSASLFKEIEGVVKEQQLGGFHILTVLTEKGCDYLAGTKMICKKLDFDVRKLLPNIKKESIVGCHICVISVDTSMFYKLVENGALSPPPSNKLTIAAATRSDLSPSSTPPPVLSLNTNINWQTIPSSDNSVLQDYKL
jgi:hypothetical protein